MSDTLIDLHTAHLQVAGKAQRTIEARVCVLRQLDRYLPFGLVYAAAEQIEAWLAGLRAGNRSACTLSVYTHHTLAFYHWAAQAGYLDADPTATIVRPRQPRGRPKPVSEEEFSIALGLAYPMGLACALAGLAGLRASEIAACLSEHITAEVLLVPVGKGGRMGNVPTHPHLWRLLQEHPPGPPVTDARGRAVDPLIRNHRGQPVTGRWLTSFARGRFDKAGLPHVHLHRLRHRFGTMIQEMTGDIRITQECMRHESIQSTVGYTLVTASRRAAVVTALPIPGPPASQ